MTDTPKTAAQMREVMDAEERGQRLLVAALDVCASGRKTASQSLCAQARDQLRVLWESRAIPCAEPDNLQPRVAPWMEACFGAEIAADRLERGDRFLEECLELLQSGDYPAERVAALTAYTYGRDKGEPSQEVGGVMITLAAYCLAHGLDMHDAGEVELARISTPEMIAKIRAKQAAKPVGSALPIPCAEPDVQVNKHNARRISECLK